MTQVRVTYAYEEGEKMQGAVITVGDATCGVIKDVPTEKKEGKKEKADDKYAPMLVWVECGEPLTGTSITITQENGEGIALCDITAFKGDRFPLELPFIYG